MKLTDLVPTQRFELEGQQYECEKVYASGRVAACYELDETGNRIPAGDSYKMHLVSDIRFNRQHETDEERELDNLL